MEDKQRALLDLLPALKRDINHQVMNDAIIALYKSIYIIIIFKCVYMYEHQIYFENVIFP